MKLGIFSWYGFESPFKYRLIKIRQIGFDFTMLWGGEETEDDYPYDNELLKSIAEINLEVENIHLPFDLANYLWTNFIECFPSDYDGILSLEVYPENKNESEEYHLHEAFRSLSELKYKIIGNRI